MQYRSYNLFLENIFYHKIDQELFFFHLPHKQDPTSNLTKLEKIMIHS